MTVCALRVVLDTNVALALEVFADPRLTDLRAHWERGGFIALADAGTLAEFERVLRYPALHLDEAAAAAAGARYRERCTLIPGDLPVPERLPLCRDPDDQKFLRLAAATGAHWLLTRDKALLALHRKVRFGIIAPPEAFAASLVRTPA